MLVKVNRKNSGYANVNKLVCKIHTAYINELEIIEGLVNQFYIEHTKALQLHPRFSTKRIMPFITTYV